MTTKHLSLFITAILLIMSCATKSTYKDERLRGTLVPNQLANDYFCLTLSEGWIQEESSEEKQFITIKKKDGFMPSIIWLVLDKQPIINEGYQTPKEYIYLLSENFRLKPEHELISSMDSINVDGHKFYMTKFLLLKEDNKKYVQRYYATDVGDFYLGIVTTEDNSELEPQVDQIIESIKFK